MPVKQVPSDTAVLSEESAYEQTVNRIRFDRVAVTFRGAGDLSAENTCEIFVKASPAPG